MAEERDSQFRATAPAVRVALRTASGLSLFQNNIGRNITKP